MKLYWIITILAIWVSIGLGFVLGACWRAYFVRVDRTNLNAGGE